MIIDIKTLRTMEVTVTMTNRTKKESVQISWLGKDKNQKKLDLLPILFIIYLMTTISHFRAYSVQTVPKLEFVFHKTSNLITASYLFCFLLHSTLPSLIFQIMNFEKGFHCWFFSIFLCYPHTSQNQLVPVIFLRILHL